MYYFFTRVIQSSDDGANEIDVEPFLKLGLTPLEAEVYACLGRGEPSTAYRVAQALGKPVGNVYKAVESLEAKGAAISADAGGTRVARAVPIDEWLAQLRIGFERASRAARAAAAGWKPPTWDERLYEIPNLDSLVSRAESALQAARQFVICTACPHVAEMLSAALVATRQRGVRVGVKVFAPIALEGCDVVCDPRGVAAVESGPGQWLFMTVDGHNLLLALLDAEGERVQQAFWSENPLLVWKFYTGLSSDLVLAALRQGLASGATVDELAESQATMRAFESPVSGGKNALLDRYRAGIRPRRKSE